MISIIIPTLNEISVIEGTLKRIRAIKNQKFEVIVSDGGSKDGTIEIARKSADKVIVYSDAKRQNISMARNSGAKESHGELIVFFDADTTIFEPDTFFETLERFFRENPGVVACTVPIRVLPELATLSDGFFFGIVNLSHLVWNNFLGIGAAAGEFQAVRRNAFEKLNGYREDLPVAEDQEFFRRLGRIGKTHFLKKLSLYHSGRRAHKIGWPKLLWLWIINGLSVALFNKSANSVWKEVR